jgi:hypothetical protein
MNQTDLNWYWIKFRKVVSFNLNLYYLIWELIFAKEMSKFETQKIWV